MAPVVRAGDAGPPPRRRGQGVHISSNAGVRYLGGGAAAVNGVTIRYRDGDEVKTEHYRQAIYACEKGPKQRKNCPEGFSSDETLRELGLLEG